MAGPGLAPLVGSIGEAWDELRVHKLRVLLSLIGVAVAVAALTAVVAIADLQRQYLAEQNDRFGGREATISIGIVPTGTDPVDGDAWEAHVDRVFQRYAFSHESHSGMFQVPLALFEGLTPVQARIVDPAFGSIHRVVMLEGRWFTDADADLLAPPVVLSQPLWEALGAPSLSTHPTVTLGDAWAGTYQVIGVTPRLGPWDEEQRLDMLYATYRAPLDEVPPDAQISREVWLSPDDVATIAPSLAQDLRAGIGEGYEVTVNRIDFGAQAGGDPLLMFTIITGAIAGIVLLLGGLGLVNIQLVAMRQRIREIGVRRSFGATGARIFVSVMLESVVATFVAGVVGIILVVVLMRQDFVIQALAPGISDIPPFPFSAALIGLLAAVAVGAVAGLIPALVAVRVKPIDAIRF